MGLSRKARRYLVASAFLTLFFLVSMAGERGFIHLFRMQRYRQDLQARISRVEEENAMLATEMERLRGDPAVIEDLARVRLGMARSGEVVYLLPSEREDGRR